jgi:uncharacterized membrane protein YiaA
MLLDLLQPATEGVSMGDRRTLMMILAAALVVIGLVNAALASPVTGLIVAACGVVLFLRAKHGGYAGMWTSLRKGRVR